MAPLQRVGDSLMMVSGGEDDASLRSVSSNEANTDVQMACTVSSTEANTDVQMACTKEAEVLRPQTKKSFRFSDYSLSYTIPSLDSFSNEELNDSFLTDEDYDRLHMENCLTLSYMARGIYPDDDQLTFRGLENGMANIYAEKKKLAAEAVGAVLRRQADNGKTALFDPAWVEAYAARFSYHSTMNAFRIGAWDAQQIQR